MEINKARPPYVTFEVRPVEDRNASIEAGHYIARDVDYAFITPQGSKDRIEFIVEDWFKLLADEVRDGRFEQQWLEGYKSSFQIWKSGQEIPENGYPVVNWPALSPAQVRLCLDFGLRTVEDVAGMNEEAINRLGMGGRALKQRAIDYLTSAKSIGIPAEELSALKSENADLKTTLTALTEQVKALQAINLANAQGAKK